MNAEEALAYINSHKWNRTRPGLERTQELLARLGNPQKRLKFVHVGGTNGKGSICAMLSSFFMEAGYRVGLYPSPYLEEFNERIQINGTGIGQNDLLRVAEMVAREADAMEDHPTQFELITAMGMVWFAEQACDIVMLEVGMGGELDSTNVIDPPEAAVLTHIGLDHTEYLGATVREITQTKCGIIKEGSCAVAYPNGPEAMDVIEEICAAKGVPLYRAADIDLKPLDRSLEGQRFEWEGRPYELSLLGAHQLENARTALAAVRALNDRGWDIKEEHIRAGFKHVIWPGRFEVIRRDPVFILDSGHNPQCAAALAEGIRDYLPGQKVTFLIGILADKDVQAVIEILYPLAQRFICVTPDSPRAMEAGDLADLIRTVGESKPGNAPQVIAEKSIGAGVQEALTHDPVIAFGSFYMAGEVRKIMKE